jgi:hypothetical protein
MLAGPRAAKETVMKSGFVLAASMTTALYGCVLREIKVGVDQMPDAVRRAVQSKQAGAELGGAEQTANKSAVGQTKKPWRDRFDVNKADLRPTGNNPYITMQPGRVLRLKSGIDTLTVTILPDTQDVDGVRVGVLEERETRNGQLVEVSRNFLATDRGTGDVYYFGEDVDNYKKGKIVDHESAWRAGARGARFGLMIPAKPIIGEKFFQEIAPKVAMDRVEVVAINETVKTPAGTFEHCVHLRETTPLESDVSHKYYAPGVGIIKDDEFELAERPRFEVR